MLWIILPLILFIIFGHFVRKKAERLRAEDGTEIVRGSLAELQNRPHVVVTIRIAGQGMATPAELHARQTLEDDIEARGIGRIADAGSGKGTMHMVVVAADAEHAAEQIRALLAEAEMHDRAEVLVRS